MVRLIEIVRPFHVRKELEAIDRGRVRWDCVAIWRTEFVAAGCWCGDLEESPWHTTACEWNCYEDSKRDKRCFSGFIHGSDCMIDELIWLNLAFQHHA